MVWPGLMPPPASHIVKACGWWSRPRNFETPRSSFMGVRPNSPPQTTRVESSKSPLLQIFEQRGRRLIGLAATRRQPDVLDVRIRARAVVIPAVVKELDEAAAALDEPARQQTVVGERGFPGLGAVELVHLGRFAPVSISSGTLVCIR